MILEQIKDNLGLIASITSSIVSTEARKDGQSIRLRLTMSGSQGTAWTYCGISCRYTITFK